MLWKNYDEAFMSNKKVISSLPYSRIAAIATEGETGFFGGTSKLYLTTMGAITSSSTSAA